MERYRLPDGRTALVTQPVGSRMLVFAHPGVTREAMPEQRIAYPDDGSLPIVLDSLDGLEAV